MVGGFLVASVSLVCVDLGEGLDVIADAGCDRRQRLPGIELGAGIPMAQIVESKVLRSVHVASKSTEGLGETVGMRRRKTLGVDAEVGEHVGPVREGRAEPECSSSLLLEVVDE